MLFLLQLDNIDSLRSFCAFRHLKFYGLAFFEGFETIHQKSGVVDEDVVALFIRDEAIALLIVEPLYSTFVPILPPYKLNKK